MTKAQLTTILGSVLAEGWPHVFINSDQSLVCALAINGRNAKNIGQEVLDKLSKASIENTAQLHNLILDLLAELREQQAQLQLAAVWLPADKDQQNLPSSLTAQADSKSSQPPKFNQAPKSNQPQAAKTDSSNLPGMVLAAYQGKIFLKRNQKIGLALQSQQQIKIVQGNVRKNDHLMLCTQQACQIEQALRQAFQENSNYSNLDQQLSKKVELLIDSSLLAVGFVQLKAQTAADLSYQALRRGSPDHPGKQTDLKTQAGQQQTAGQQEASQQADQERLAAMPSAATSSRHRQETNQSHLETSKLKPKQQAKQVITEDENGDLKIKISFDPIIKLAQKTGSLLKSAAQQIYDWIQQLFTVVKKRLNHSQKQAAQTSTPTKTQTQPKIKSAAKAANKVGPNQFLPQAASLAAGIVSLAATIPSLTAAGLKSIRNLIFNRSVYLENKKSKKAVKIVLLIILVIGILLGAVFFIRSRIQQQRRQAESALEPARELLQQAEQLMDHDIIAARDQTSQAIEIIVAEQKDFDQRYGQKIFEDQLAQARNFYDEISGLIEVSQLNIFLDLSDLSDNFLSYSADINDQFMLFFDRQQQQVLYFNQAQQQAQILNFQDIQPQDIAAAADKALILGSGIHQISTAAIEEGEVDQLQILKTEGDSDRNAIILDYFRGYVYVFNPEKRNIYRYIDRDDELSDPIGWLTNKQDIKFNQITSMAIDGNIWLADNEGVIHKLDRGEPVDFEITGLSENFGGSIQLFANHNTSYLYVLEPEKSRLVLLSPEGELITQITSPSLASATQIFVDEDSQQAYAVSGSLVYQINLE